MNQRKYQPSAKFTHIREVPEQDLFPTLVATTFETIAFYHASTKSTDLTIRNNFIEILNGSYGDSETLCKLKTTLTNRDIELLDSMLDQRAVLGYFSSIVEAGSSDIQQIKQFCEIFKVEVILKWENSHLMKFLVAGAPKIFLSKSGKSTFVIHYPRINAHPDEALKSFSTHISTKGIVCSNGYVTDKPTENHYDGQSIHYIYDKETVNIAMNQEKSPCDICNTPFNVHRNTEFTCKCRICENCIITLHASTERCIKCDEDYQEIDLAFIEKVIQNKSGRTEEANSCVKCTSRLVSTKILECECKLCDHCLSESSKLGSCSNCNNTIFFDTGLDLDSYLQSIMIVETEITCKVCKEDINEAEMTKLVCGCKVCAVCLQPTLVNPQLSISDAVDLSICAVSSMCHKHQESRLLSCNCSLCPDCVYKIDSFYGKCQFCSKALSQDDFKYIASILNERRQEHKIFT